MPTAGSGQIGTGFPLLNGIFPTRTGFVREHPNVNVALEARGRGYQVDSCLAEYGLWLTVLAILQPLAYLIGFYGNLSSAKEIASEPYSRLKGRPHLVF